MIRDVPERAARLRINLVRRNRKSRLLPRDSPLAHYYSPYYYMYRPPEAEEPDVYHILYWYIDIHMLGGTNPAVNTPRPSTGTRIESCDFIVLIGDP